MSKLLASTANTRAVLPGSLRILRSDAPLSPAPEDIAFLLEHDVTTLIDLRSAEEICFKPCPLAADARFTYRHMPVTGGNTMPATPADVPYSYLRMADEQMNRILDLIRSAPAGVMFFCTAGKDRTGVVSALLQQEAGLTREAIAADYALSGKNLQALFAAFRAAHPDIDADVYAPKAEYMLQFLDLLNRK